MNIRSIVVALCLLSACGSPSLHRQLLANSLWSITVDAIDICRGVTGNIKVVLRPAGSPTGSEAAIANINCTSRMLVIDWPEQL